MKIRLLTILTCVLMPTMMLAENSISTTIEIFSTAEKRNAYSATENDGSKTRPYTVAEVAAMKVDKTKEFWVRGTIYGTMLASLKIEEVTTSAAEFSSSNLVIGDETVRIPIQLPQGDIRNEINLKTHSYLQGKEILIKGKLESYCGSMGVKSPSAYQITYTIPINSYGYATLFLDMPVAVPEGCTAYYCTTDGNTANLLPVNTIIPAEIGVVITYTPGAKCSFTYTTVANNKDDFEKNQLIGYTQDTDITDSDNTYYALNVKDGQVGFYIPQTENGDGSFTAKAGKAYLKVPAESQVKEFLFSRGNEETIVAPITTHYSDEVIYDLQGRVVSSPTAGVYIKAGKKFIIK